MQGYGGISCWLLGETAELSREARAPAEEIEVITNPPSPLMSCVRESSCATSSVLMKSRPPSDYTSA